MERGFEVELNRVVKPFNRQREAVRMLDLFGSVGAQRFDLTFIDIDGRLQGFRAGRQIVDARRSMCSTLIPSCLERNMNIIVRPHAPRAVSLIQLDDLDSAALERVKPAVFLVLETSPGNHQAWAAVEGWSEFLDFGRRVKKAAGADLNASGAVRVAGSVNFKRKYAPNFPTVVIVEARLGQILSASKLDAMGLVAAAEVPRTINSGETRRGAVLRVSDGGRRKWPDYARNLAAARRTKDGQADRSNADFVWCMTAVDWGWSVEATAAQLLQVSEKAREQSRKRHDVGYPLLTAQRAAAVVRGRKAAAR